MLGANGPQITVVSEVKVQLLPWKLRLRDLHVDVGDGLTAFDVGGRMRRESRST